MDIEVPAKSPRPFSHITRNGRHILQLETVLVTIYYPSVCCPGADRDLPGNKQCSGGNWLPRPQWRMAQGYGKFSGLPQWPSMLWYMATTGFTRIPAFRNARLATHWLLPQNCKIASPEVKNHWGNQPQGQSEEPIFPVMMFSHGMGGSRTAYSCLCGDFASYGFVVVALEHRDGTGARTFVNHTPAGSGSRPEREVRGNVNHWDWEAKRKYDVIDYIFPKDNPMDTRPDNPKGVDHELRSAQLALRLAEIEEAYRVISIINDGKGSEVAACNLRKAGGIGAPSLGLEGVDWSAWTGRLDISQVTMLGHSFGAAATIEILRQNDRFQWVKQAIIYDIWGGPLQPASDPEYHIKVPLLGINSEAFMYWENNLKTATSVCHEASQRGALSWLMTVRGTIHTSQSDFCLLYPHIASLILKMTLKPQRAIDINISASLEFLAEVMPHPFAPFSRSLRSERILDKPCIADLPTEHKPDQKWMAVRLKLDHEARGRLVPKLRRQLKRVGGIDGSDSEVWMHVAPTREALEQWRRERHMGVTESAGKSWGPTTDGTSKPSMEIDSSSKGFVSATTPVWPLTKG